MDVNFLKYYEPKVLIIIVVGIGISLFIAKIHWGIPLAIISTISFLLVIINKWLWKYLPFLFWVPNISGRYEGELEYSFRNENCDTIKGNLKHVKVINQTGSKLVIDSFTYKKDGTPSSPSQSEDVSIIKESNGSYKLIYTYLNKGSNEQGFPPHYGTEVVRIIYKDSKKFLTGNYYTDRLPFQTRGKFINLKYKEAQTSLDF